MNTWSTLGDHLRRRYRASGAELPGGDLVGARGVSMDGWFWRITDPGTGRVVFALAGLCTPQRGAPWGIVGMGADPATALATARLDRVHAGPGMDLDLFGEQGHFRASRHHLDVRIGEARLRVDLSDQVDWQGRLGGSSLFQLVPRLNQYWHPWLLGGRVDGSFTAPGVDWRFEGSQLYAEKNWGRGGFPVHWWWGQAQGFDEPSACLAFAGGTIHLGRPGRDARLTTEVTALVLRTPDGEQVRLGNPGTSPVTAQVADGHWRLRGRSRRWQLEVDAYCPLAEAFVLPVPLVEQGRLAPGALEAQLGELQVTARRDGRLHWQATTRMAALESGGREAAEAELARRGGDARPQRPGRTLHG
ncbi:tocopherol cyclase family protein [Luteococcus peritonei]|uniref:Tocopherol cyclase family protein n=1 Tax=Luteococcus peritonei TaxID=88874 RepID=A0ABW4RV36_9ACTN